MSIRQIILFDGQKAAKALRLQWAQKGAAQPIPLGTLLLNADRTATPFFRSLWSSAFPLRQPLPFAALSERDGRGTSQFWNVFE